MTTALATIPAVSNGFRQLTTPKGNPGKKVMEFLGEGIKSISAGRKLLREQGLSAKDAKNLINAALRGDEAQVAKLKAQTFFSDSIAQGYVPTLAEESATGAARTIKMERVKGKDDSSKVIAAKNAEIEELKAKLAALSAG